LKEILGPILLQRTKAGVLEDDLALPKKNIDMIMIDFSEVKQSTFGAERSLTSFPD
jgi:hypothetical protein